MMATVGTAGRARGFEIGLVMAGAVSAGAYTAGVVDFLSGFVEAGASHLVLRFAGDHQRHLEAVAKIRDQLPK